MDLFRKIFVSNSLKDKTRKTVLDSVGFNEKDAVAVEYDATHNENRSEMRAGVGSGLGDLEDSYNNSADVSDQLVYSNSTNNAQNTINVHNDNQRILMQISNANSLHFGSVFNINSDHASSSSAASKCKKNGNPKDKTKFNKKTRTVDVMMNHTREPSHRILDTIATHLGRGYRQVMRELGFSAGQISQSELDNHIHGTKEIIYQLLLDWLNNCDDKSRTLGYLTNVLWNCGEYECVHRMKDTWKLESYSNKI